ncbi:MAG: hypothetical protein ACYTFG_12005, partial [Planctomycetota bacterium]
RPRKIFEIWAGGAPGTLAPWVGSEEEKEEEGGPDPGPLFSKKEEWVLKRSDLDRLLAVGHTYLRAAVHHLEKAEEAEETFARHNTRALRFLQKARPFFEKAWIKGGGHAVAQHVNEINSRILRTIEAARER